MLPTISKKINPLCCCCFGFFFLLLLLLPSFFGQCRLLHALPPGSGMSLSPATAIHIPSMFAHCCTQIAEDALLKGSRGGRKRLGWLISWREIFRENWGKKKPKEHNWKTSRDCNGLWKRYGQVENFLLWSELCLLKIHVLKP